MRRFRASRALELRAVRYLNLLLAMFVDDLVRGLRAAGRETIPATEDEEQLRAEFVRRGLLP